MVVMAGEVIKDTVRLPGLLLGHPLWVQQLLCCGDPQGLLGEAPRQGTQASCQQPPTRRPGGGLPTSVEPPDTQPGPVSRDAKLGPPS